MIVRVRSWYGGLTQRERVLVVVAGGLAAALVLVYGIVLPLGRAHDAAHERHRAAVEASAQVLAQLAALETTGARGPQSAVGPVTQVLAASADAAGFVLQTNQPQGNDAAVIVVPNSAPAAVLAWLDRLAASGLVVENLTMTPAADGSVAVNATVRRSGR